MTDLLIIGGGMAGLTAALYALRAGKRVLMTEKETFGGQITSAPRIENYPGLPGVSGNQLTDAVLSQALELGLEIELEDILSLRKTADGFIASAAKREYAAKAVILATGAKHRPLGIAHENAWVGHGVSYCALCDGAFHRGEDVAVVGGGNSAAQAAVFLADICKSVTVIQNFDHFTCDRRDLAAMQSRDSIHFCLSSCVTALEGEERLRCIRLEHQQTGEQTELPVTGLFVCIGRMADNAPFANLVALDAQGFIQAGEDCRTNVPGIFAAGDCRAKAIRQLTTAAADGAVAATAACRYIG